MNIRHLKGNIINITSNPSKIIIIGNRMSTLSIAQKTKPQFHQENQTHHTIHKINQYQLRIITAMTINKMAPTDNNRYQTRMLLTLNNLHKINLFTKGFYQLIVSGR